MSKKLRKNLAFDFDDVIYSTTKDFLIFNKRKYGYAPLYSTLSKVKLFENLDITEKEEDKRWDEFFKTPQCYSNPSKNLVKTLKVLQKKYNLIIISARDKKWQFQIRKWIQMYIPNVFEKIIFLNGKKSKGILCRDNETLFLFEDDPRHIRSCIKYKMPVIVIDQPWNRQINKKIPRVKSITESVNMLL